jgi:hypothetical protein
MTTRSSFRKAIPLFVFSFLYLLSSCDSASPDVIKDNAKPELVKIHLAISDSSGKRLIDTVYKSKLAALDTFRIQPMVYRSGVPTRTGGSSPCTVTMDVWKGDDDDDKK